MVIGYGNIYLYGLINVWVGVGIGAGAVTLVLVFAQLRFREVA